jgi:PIN domain nuclease of toxin-antitoxin system
MANVVADTHSIVWCLMDDPRLSKAAGFELESAQNAGDLIFAASITLVELTYLAEKGPVALEALILLRVSLTDPSFGFPLAPLDLAVADAIARIPRDQIPDLPDRVIAATALARNLPLINCDEKIRGSDVPTIW